jgi:hypothetical protein
VAPGRPPSSRAPARRPPYARRRALTLGCFGLVVVLVVVAVVGVFGWLRGRGVVPPVPGQERCVATAGDSSVVLDLDQAYYASIVVGVSVRRGLAPRAASIALATVYQETGIRNLDYGDRDSVGLFQQRPSQGWGTEKQLLDPYYATGKFYDALVRVKGWQNGDITKIAQKVQRSGYPEAYRDHEADARVLASALTGSSTRAFSCLVRDAKDADGKGLAAALTKTFRSGSASASGGTVTLTASSTRRAWAYAHYAVANASRYGVVAVRVGDRQWATDQFNLPGWESADDLGGKHVEITLGP